VLRGGCGESELFDEGLWNTGSPAPVRNCAQGGRWHRWWGTRLPLPRAARQL